MPVRLRLTDHQLAVAERLRDDEGAETFGRLAAAAIDHERRRPAEPRWADQRPRPRRARSGPSPAERRFDAVLPAASGVTVTLTAGERLRLEQLKDGQCVDLSAFASDGRGLSAARTRSIHGLRPTVGASLWSTPPHRRLLTIVADSAPGHDLCFPPCSEREYREHSGVAGHLGCAELHAAASARHGLDRRPASDDVLNLWLPSAIDATDGRLRSWPAACRRGDSIELQARCDVIVVLSTCPDDLFGSSQYEPGPVRVVVSAAPPARPARLPARWPAGLPARWPTAPPPSALARHEVTVELDAFDIAHVDRIAATGWLGSTRATVLRALIFRLHESRATAPVPLNGPDWGPRQNY